MSKERHLKDVRLMVKRRMHKGVWSSKCQVFYDFFSDVIMNCPPIEKILNIGVGPDKESDAWNRFLHRVFPSASFHNLEYDEGLVNKWKKTKNTYLNSITHGDVRKIDEVFDENSFDLIFWNQGPEHIYRKEWEDTFPKLEKIAKHVVYLHCPWGSGYDSDQWHYSKSIRRGEFEPFGFRVVYHGKENTRDAGIMSWKIL